MLTTITLSVAIAVPDVALVGLMGSLMTAKLVHDITDTPSDKTRESWGQGVANIVTGFFGGMDGGDDRPDDDQREGLRGRTRLPTFLAGVFLLILVVGLGDITSLIPMAALVAVMVMVAVGPSPGTASSPPSSSGCPSRRRWSWSPPS